MDDRKKLEAEVERDFKENMFKIFSEQVPGTYIDEDGIITVPVRRQRKHSDNLNTDNQE